MPVKKPDVAANFFSKISRDSETNCWLWTGGKKPNGYGVFCVNRYPLYAHRWSYEFHKGAIPQGYVVDHLCGIHHCVNPDHLEAVTQKENILRGQSTAAQNAKKTHCPKGHSYRTLGRGDRYCPVCQVIRQRGRYYILPKEKKTHCSKGHPFDELNTIWGKDGQRRCRACKEVRKRKVKHKRGQALAYCSKGHEYTEANTYIQPNGRRRCRECRKGHDERRLLRRKPYQHSLWQKAALFHTERQWGELKAQYEYTCLRCGKREPEITLTRDHVIPRHKNGADTIDNLQPLCMNCNIWNRNKMIDFRGKNP